jgi:outer membrane protein TolC
MSRPGKTFPALVALVATILSGCFAAPKTLTYLGYSDLRYYKDLATKIDTPAAAACDNPDALGSKEPQRIRHPSKEQIWDLSLADAVLMALQNNKVIRVRDQFLSPRNPLIAAPDAVPSVFDPAIQETGVLFNQRGVEAALADFDAQFTTSMTWGRNETISNNRFLSGGLSPGDTLVEETAAFRARLDKTFADSSQFSVIHNWDYSLNNVTERLFPSAYTGVLRTEFRRPLLAGAGVEYTRIAGPINRNTVGVAQGVVISRINNDMAIADFEAAAHNLVREVETSYWELSLAYRSYHAQVVAWHSAIETWRSVKAKAAEGLEGGAAADEAQARDTLFDTEARAEDALGNLYLVEGQFRRLLGLATSDGRIIRPCDEPTTAELIPDWHIAVAEGITRRPEIRRQKWNIKSQELQLCAARNLLQPRLDFVAGYQVNAFGDALLGGDDDDGTTRQGLHNAYETLTQGNQTGWNLGLEASIPLGLRREHAQVRNIEFLVARARAALAAQELEVAHEIRNAFQSLDRSYAVARSAFNRRVAAEERVKAFQALYDVRGTSVDALLRAQQSLAQAEVSYFQALIQYNQAITDFHYRTGTILEENNVTIAEGPWSPKAYADALRRAWARSHAVDNNMLCTAPGEFVIPGAPSGPSLATRASLFAPPDPVGGGPAGGGAAGQGGPAGNAPQAAPVRRAPGPESEPAAPLPASPPSNLPQAGPRFLEPGSPIQQVSATSEALRGSRPLQAGSAPTVGEPQFVAPIVSGLRTGQPDDSAAIAPARPASSRRPLDAPGGFAPPIPASRAGAAMGGFVAPRVSRPSPASGEEFPGSSPDPFAMPLNQLGGK